MAERLQKQVIHGGKTGKGKEYERTNRVSGEYKEVNGPGDKKDPEGPRPAKERSWREWGVRSQVFGHCKKRRGLENLKRERSETPVAERVCYKMKTPAWEEVRVRKSVSVS